MRSTTKLFIFEAAEILPCLVAFITRPVARVWCQSVNGTTTPCMWMLLFVWCDKVDIIILYWLAFSAELYMSRLTAIQPFCFKCKCYVLSSSANDFKGPLFMAGVSGLRQLQDCSSFFPSQLHVWSVIICLPFQCNFACIQLFRWKSTKINVLLRRWV